MLFQEGCIWSGSRCDGRSVHPQSASGGGVMRCGQFGAWTFTFQGDTYVASFGVQGWISVVADVAVDFAEDRVVFA